MKLTTIYNECGARAEMTTSHVAFVAFTGLGFEKKKCSSSTWLELSADARCERLKPEVRVQTRRRACASFDVFGPRPQPAVRKRKDRRRSVPPPLIETATIRDS
ncbi:MAG: hypothetical protein MI923_13115 [Phycisphaerales bacterium]|nr:hypothetical protein [Phycisphaerales bacterium]